ncbi:MAG: DNA-protecting protein DprA [Rhodobacterales bacterium]|nr:MAG: DNA-protecting protein DprA [Rhodobacterales bacterium]
MAENLFSSHPTLTPPTTEENRLLWLRLLRSRRVGISTFFRLMSEHGSAAAAFAVLPEIARAAGVPDYQPCPEAVARAEMRAARAAGARMLCYGEADYPADLADISDAPPILWTIGQRQLLHRPMVALVGARNASSLGGRMARKLAGELSEAGYVVVSGLARGIDTIAHQASLKGGTLAVQAGGVDVAYPRENANLMAQIVDSGLRLSEIAMGVTPQARHFPRRNRIISGLARAVIVVEAAAHSGSLITAKNALDQGREVLAVPGHPFDARAFGCNVLLRDGATLVRSAADVIEVLGLPEPCTPSEAPTPKAHTRPPEAETARAPYDNTSRPQRSLRETADLHSQILARLGPSPVAEDQLVRDLALPIQKITPELLNLELDGKIIRVSGGMLSLAH